MCVFFLFVSVSVGVYIAETLYFSYLLAKWCHQDFDICDARAEKRQVFHTPRNSWPVSTCEASWLGLLNRHTLEWDKVTRYLSWPMSIYEEYY